MLVSPFGCEDTQNQGSGGLTNLREILLLEPGDEGGKATDVPQMGRARPVLGAGQIDKDKEK